MAFSDIFQQICCCSNPVVHDDDEVVRIPTTPTTLTASGTRTYFVSNREENNADGVNNSDVVTPLDDDVAQSEVFPVSWKEDGRSEVDLRDIPEVSAVVARPDDVDQPELHPVSWPSVKKGTTAWGGDGVVPNALEEGANGHKQTGLPLPWENGGKLTPVPFDKGTTGPSWEHQ